MGRRQGQNAHSNRAKPVANAVVGARAPITNLLQLPPEMLATIFEILSDLLPIPELRRLGGVCRTFQDILKSPRYWQRALNFMPADLQIRPNAFTPEMYRQQVVHQFYTQMATRPMHALLRDKTGITFFCDRIWPLMQYIKKHNLIPSWRNLQLAHSSRGQVFYTLKHHAQGHRLAMQDWQRLLTISDPDNIFSERNKADLLGLVLFAAGNYSSKNPLQGFDIVAYRLWHPCALFLINKNKAPSLRKKMIEDDHSIKMREALELCKTTQARENTRHYGYAGVPDDYLGVLVMIFMLVMLVVCFLPGLQNFSDVTLENVSDPFIKKLERMIEVERELISRFIKNFIDRAKNENLIESYGEHAIAEVSLTLSYFSNMIPGLQEVFKNVNLLTQFSSISHLLEIVYSSQVAPYLRYRENGNIDLRSLYQGTEKFMFECRRHVFVLLQWRKRSGLPESIPDNFVDMMRDACMKKNKEDVEASVREIVDRKNKKIKLYTEQINQRKQILYGPSIILLRMTLAGLILCFIVTLILLINMLNLNNLF